MTRERKINLIRWGIWTLLLILAFLLQNTKGLFPSFHLVRCYLIIPLVICISLFEREIVGAVFGLIGGLLWDLVSPQVTGFHAMVLMLMCGVCGFFITYLMRNTLLTALLMCGITLVIHTLLYWALFIAIPGYEGASSALWSVYMPSALYSFALLPIMYFLTRSVRKRFRTL